MVDSITQYIPKSFYDAGGNLSIAGDNAAEAKETADAVAAGIQAYVSTLPPADAARFMAAVNSASADTFAPGGKVAPDLTARLSSLEGGAASFKAMLANVNDFDLLARVMIQQFGEERHAAVTDRMQMRQLAQQELLASAGQLRKEASDMMAGAVSSLVLSVVSGALSIAGAVSTGAGKVSGINKSQEGEAKLGSIESHLSMKGGEGESADAVPSHQTKWQSATPSDEGSPSAVDNKGVKQSKDDEYSQMTTGDLLKAKAQAKIDILEGDKIMARSDRLGQTMGVVGHLFESMSGTAKSFSDAQVKGDEADAKVAEAAAEQLNTAAELKKAMVDTLDDAMKQLIATVKDLIEAKAERMRSFTHI